MSHINRFSGSVDSSLLITPGFVSNDTKIAEKGLSQTEIFVRDSLVKQHERRNYGDMLAFNLQSKFAVSGETNLNKQVNKSASYIETKADSLIESSKVNVRKFDAGKLMNALAQQSVKNPKLVAIALSRPEIQADRYNFAKGLSMRLSDAQLKQLSQTETGRSFLRSMMDVVYTEAPPERGNPESEMWRQIDKDLLSRVQSKVLEYSKKDWSETKPFPNEELQGDKAAKFAKQADGIINLGKVIVKEIDGGKLLNILVRDALKHPGTVTTALYRPEVRGNSYELAKGVLNRLNDNDLQELARTQPGQTLLKNLYNTILSEAPAERANNQEWLNGERQLLGRVTKALEIDKANRAQFQGVSADQLVQAMKTYGLSRERANELVPDLNQAMYEYKIDTPLKQAAFLAQISVETGGLTKADFKETGGEKQKYAPFFGRGAIQLSLKDSYQQATEYFGKPFINNLDLVAEKENAFQTAGWFWSKYKGHDASLMLSADSTKNFDEFNKISLLVNGGKIGYDDRIKNLKNSLEALNMEGRQAIIKKIDDYFAPNKSQK